MNAILSFARRNPILVFALLAYLFSWWPAPFLGGVILSWGLIPAAWIVLKITEGKPGIRDWKQRIMHWRVAWYWYLIGPGIIVLYVTSAFAINIMLGAVVIHFPQVPDLITCLTLLLVGGQWEELGWSGYALPTLQKRFASHSNGPLLAALTVGSIRMIWHLPLVLSGHIAWFDMVFLSFAIQLIFAWLFNRTGGSVPVIMLTHYVSNLSGSAFSGVFVGRQWTNYYVMFIALALLIALGIVWKSGLQLGQRETQGQSALANQKVIKL